jgi:hypothetical protein
MSLASKVLVLSTKLGDLISDVEDLEPDVQEIDAYDHLNQLIDLLTHAQYHAERIY